MTTQEQASDIAMRYINGTKEEKEIIESFFNGEEREIFLKAVGMIHLFTDADYYDKIKNAVQEKVVNEVYA